MDTSQNSFVGLYLRHIIRDLRTGYTVFLVAVEKEVIQCTGIIIPPRNQVKVDVAGTWVRSPYGIQLSNCVIHEVVTDPMSLTDYLMSIPGIGAAITAQIRERVGASLFRITQQADPVRSLADQASIPESKAEIIVSHIMKKHVHAQLFSFITHFGGTFANAEKIYAKYVERAMTVLSSDPYRVCFDAGIQFNIADAIAKSFGVKAMDKKRIIAAVETVLGRCAAAGNTYMPLDSAIKSVRRLLGNSASEQSLSAIVIADAVTSGADTLYLEGGNIYLRYLYWQEVRTAHALKRLIRYGVQTECDPEELCTYAEGVCGVKYAERQREIFKALQHGGVCVLTGGPGTGKTTVVKGFLTAYEKLFPDKTIRLCAPTGRASQRMHEATERPATTIHRLIEYKPFGDTAVCKNESDPIDADCVVVDECSMISIDVAELLFNAIRPGTMVLLVGDVEQLPAVGAGNVLGDIINSKVAPVVALTKTQRQGAGSPIIENARRIREGDPELMVNRADFRIISAEDDSIPGIVQQLYSQYHNPDDPFKAQVLTPSRKNRLTGSKVISKNIRKAVNKNPKSIRYGDMQFSVGDKVMTIQNNYSIGYFNGDVGIIRHIGQDSITIDLGGSSLTIPLDCLEDVILAYACTVHKSQGSEYETVILALPSEPLNMLQRNILYTAITRAKKRVFIVAAENAVMTCVCTETTNKRQTTLSGRLQKGLPRNKEEML